MKINIYLDDVRSLPFGYHCQAYTYEECLYFLEKFQGEINTLSLDHDLGDYEPQFHTNNTDKGPTEKTGYDVICWIEEMHQTTGFSLPNRIYTHSANPVGVRRIQQVIERLYPR